MKVDSPFPPAIVQLASGRYVVGGSKWIKVDPTFTLQQAHDAWTPPKINNVQPSGTKTFQVASSKGDQIYQVVFASGHYSCTCTGFGFRRRCKHVDQAKSLNQ